MARKIQLPAIGGFRKVIVPGGAPASTGTTIAGLEGTTVSLAQLLALLKASEGTTPNTQGDGSQAFIQVGGGLEGGGPVLGVVHIDGPGAIIPSSLAWDSDGGEEGPQGFPGAQGQQGPIGSTFFMIGEDGQDGMDGLPGGGGSGGVGPPGPTGATGAQGPIGYGFDGMDGADGMDGLPAPPAAPGPQGPAGPTGAQGPIGFGFDGYDGDDSMIPGPSGPTGATGATGPTGPTGPIGPLGTALFMLPEDGLDGMDGLPSPPQSSGGGGTPGGSDMMVQYNKAGTFFGDSNFEWNYTTQQLTLVGLGSNAPLLVNAASGNAGIRIQGASGSFASLQLRGGRTGNDSWEIATDVTTAGTLTFFNDTNAASALDVNVNSQWTWNAPSAGGQTAFTFNGRNGNNMALFQTGAGSGTAYGVVIVAGTTSADYSLLVENQAGTKDYFEVRGDGALLGWSASQSAQMDMTPDFNNFSITGVGFSGTAPSGTMQYIRYGKMVVMYCISAMAGTSNSTSFSWTGLPAAIQTARAIIAPCGDCENNTGQIGNCSMAFISASGTVIMHLNGLAAGWTASGTKGIELGCTCVYSIN